MTKKELDRLHSYKLAVPNRTYTLDNGDTYIGTSDRRVKRIVVSGQTIDEKISATQTTIINQIPTEFPVVTDGTTITGDGTASDPLVAAPAGGTPAGNDGEVQFNDGGAFGAEDTFHFDKTTVKLSIGSQDTMSVNGVARESHLAVHSEGGTASVELELHKHSDSAGAGATGFGARSRGTEGSEAIVQDNDALLRITAVGYDGTDYASAGQILISVDGTPGSDDMPGRISIQTTPSGSQAPVERILIEEDGSVTIADISGTGTEMVTADINGKLSKQAIPNTYLAVTTQTTDYTLALADAWSLIEVNGATYVTITIPLNSSVAFPIGTLIWLNQKGLGQAVVAATGGVTMTSPDSYVHTRVQDSTIRLQKVGTDTWELAEDLGVATGLDPDAAAFIAAVGSFSVAEQGYINTFFEALKAEGSLYTKTHYCHIYVGSTLAEHKLNIVDPVDADTSFRLTDTASPGHSSAGVSTNGTTSWVNTHYVPGTYAAQDNKAYAMYYSTVGSAANFGGHNGTNAGDYLYIGVGTLYWGISSGLYSTTTPGTKPGFYLLNRTTSTNAVLSRNDVTLSTVATASTNNYASNLAAAGGRLVSGVLTQPSADVCNFDWGGESLSAAEATALYNAVVALNTSLGR